MVFNVILGPESKWSLLIGKFFRNEDPFVSMLIVEADEQLSFLSGPGLFAAFWGIFGESGGRF